MTSAGNVKRSPRAAWTPAKDDLLRAWYAQRMSYDQMATRLNITVAQVDWRVRFLGLAAGSAKSKGQRGSKYRVQSLTGCRPPAPSLLSGPDEARACRARQLLAVIPAEGVVTVKALVRLAGTTADYIKAICAESPSLLTWHEPVAGHAAVGRAM